MLYVGTVCQADVRKAAANCQAVSLLPLARDLVENGKKALPQCRAVQL